MFFFGFILWFFITLCLAYGNRIKKFNMDTWTFVGVSFAVGCACIFWPITLPIGLMMGAATLLIKIAKG